MRIFDKVFDYFKRIFQREQPYAKMPVFDGGTIEVTLDMDMPAGGPILLSNKVLGVCLIDGAKGDEVPIAVEGVFRLEKSNDVFFMADMVHFKDGVLNNNGCGPIIGVAYENAAKSAETVAVKLMPHL